MTPDWLTDEIADALDDLLTGSGWGLERVEPPPDLGPDREVGLELTAPDGTVRRVALAVGLATAYLADEESAVDAFESWLRDLLVDV